MILVYAILVFIGALAMYMLGYARGQEMERNLIEMDKLNQQMLDIARCK